MSWFDDWCFYCKTKHGTSQYLRDHVREKHPDSIRESNYRRAEDHGSDANHQA